MSDPLRFDGTRAHDAESGSDRDAKIEQLLLVGLDHYFAARYELAINVWTRALFLDRSHARARAYIERARSALAERQRESEELLQNGVAAFQRGDGDEARRLLQAAIERGAPTEDALAVLERIDRFEAAALPAAAAAPAGRTSRRGSPRAAGGPSRSAGRIVAWLSVSAAVVALAAFTATTDRIDWRELTEGTRSVVALARSAGQSVTVAAPAPPAPVAIESALPVPRRGETALGRARALHAGGRLRDALAMLDSIRPTDPQMPDANRLRADIQRQLLALTTVPATAAADVEKDGRPVP
jgi:tetratricopeptide (TPR) repeat protein